MSDHLSDTIARQAAFHETLRQLLDDDDSDELKNEFMTQNFNPAQSEYDSDIETRFKLALTANDIACEFVDHYGGEEQGRKYWSIYKFTRGEDTIYIKFSGWYASFVGSEYEEWAFVSPVEKTIIVYM